MKKIISMILYISFGICVVLGVLSILSRKAPDLGLKEGRLMPCPKTSNCVCSERPESRSFVRPFDLTGTPEDAWMSVKGAVSEMGGRIEVMDEGYLRASFSTSIFRFQDDLECRLAPQQGLIHVRSSSRVGISDFGMNRKRVKKMRQILNKQRGLAEIRWEPFI